MKYTATRVSLLITCALVCYAFTPSASAGGGACCVPGVPCPADITGDEVVGVPDLLELLGCWGPVSSGCEPADLVTDGTIGVPDLLELLANWGPCAGPVNAACEALGEADCDAAGGVWLGAGAICENVVCDPVPASFEFYQLDLPHVEDGIPLSDWGTVEVTYQTGSSLRYLNMAIQSSPNSPAESWQIQNMPLHSSSTPGSLRTIQFAFDLGNAIGEVVDVVSFGATVTNAPAEEPAIDRDSTVAAFEIGLQPGQHGGIFLYHEPEPLIFPVTGLADGENPVEEQNENVPNQPQGPIECVPGAVSNSLQFLNETHDMNMPDGAIDMDSMKDATGWAPDGAEPAPDWTDWKDTFMKEQGYQIITELGTIDDVIQALSKDHDVELDLGWNAGGAHAVVIVGVTQSRADPDVYTITIQDDSVQDGSDGNQRTLEVTYNRTTGAIAGFAGAAFERSFTIERPADPAEKTCEQIATSLLWAQSHLQAAAAILDDLITDQGQPADVVAEKQEKAKEHLESAAELLAKNLAAINSAIENGGGEGCPPIEALESMRDAIEDMIEDLAGALEALQSVIDNPDMPADERKELYGQARDAANGAATAIGDIIDQHFCCRQIARALQRLRRNLDIIRGAADRLIGMVNAAAPNQAMIDSMNGFLKQKLGVAAQQLADARAKIQAKIDAGGGGTDCPSVETLQGMLAELDTIAERINQANAALQNLLSDPTLTPEQMRQIYNNIRNLIDQARALLNPIIDQLLTPAAPPPEVCNPDNPNDCCEAITPSPGCNNPLCCAIVCSNDPFCCEVSWDGLCAGAAIAIPECGCAPSSDCCFPHPTPGCGDPDCEKSVCSIDPFCCDIQWGASCANLALKVCPNCQGD